LCFLGAGKQGGDGAKARSKQEPPFLGWRPSTFAPAEVLRDAGPERARKAAGKPGRATEKRKQEVPGRASCPG
jgi:hypothetical protein